MLTVALAQAMPDPRTSWFPVVLLILLGLSFAVGTIAMSLLVGPKRQGTAKSQPYESGMTPIGNARRRFNVRFYIVAMVFLVFDVALAFLYPFSAIFAPYVKYAPEQAGEILLTGVIFISILLLAYVYAWGKGVFQFD